jgi:hypothetical protein
MLDVIEQWLAKEDRAIVLETTGKGVVVIVWDQDTAIGSVLVLPEEDLGLAIQETVEEALDKAGKLA